MKFIKITKGGLTMEQGSPWAKTLLAEKYYLVSDLIHQQISYIVPDRIYKNVIHLEEVYKKYKGEDLNGKRLFVWRHGGIGDLMFMMPPLRLLKVKYPDSKIMVGLGGKYFDIYRHVPYVDEVHQLPVDLETFQFADYHLHFEQIIEGNPMAERANAYDLFLHKFGFDPNKISSAEKLPDIFLTDGEKKFAEDFIERFKVKEDSILVGLQIASSSAIRSIPDDLTVQIAGLIARESNGRLILFGSKAQEELAKSIKWSLPEECHDRIKSSAEEGFNLRKTMAVTRYCDLVIAPDSAMIHIAGALRVPMIGLYGPFPADLRMRYYYNALAINACSPCSPCFTHEQNPCTKGFPSPCFSLIDLHQIMHAIEYLLSKTNKKSIPTIKKQMKSIFDQVIDKAKPYMKGKGLDVGCGFQKYNDEFDVTRIDVNPLVDPDIVNNFFAENFKVDEKVDYIINSYAIKTINELNAFLEKSDAFLNINGYLILFIGDANILSKAKEISILSKYLKDYIGSTLTSEDIQAHLSAKEGYEIVEVDLPPPIDEKKEALEIFETRHGIFIVMRKIHE